MIILKVAQELNKNPKEINLGSSIIDEVVDYKIVTDSHMEVLHKLFPDLFERTPTSWTDLYLLFDLLSFYVSNDDASGDSLM